MEKKSALIGGGIGLAVGMATMFGLVLGIGSCAGSQNVKKVNLDSVLVVQPKKAQVPSEDLPVPVYKLVSTDIKSNYTFLDLEGVSSTGLYQVYYDTIGNPTAGQYAVQDREFTAGRNSNAQSYFGLRDGGTINISVSGGVTTGGNVSSLSNVYLTYSSVQSSEYGSYFLGLYNSYTLGYYDATGTFTEGFEPEPEVEHNVVTDIFEQVVSSISSFGTALGSSVSAITSVFYQDGAFTMLGYLTLITGGVALVYWCFYLLKNALHIGVK